MDDNIFDEDDSIDYIMYKECEKESNQKSDNGGCLSII